MPPTISHDSSTSYTLLERVKLREPEAWRRLVELYGPIVYRWCRRYRLSPDDAADVVQDVFANVARHMDRFEHRAQHGGFRSWLSTITHNEVCDFFRREQRQAQARPFGVRGLVTAFLFFAPSKRPATGAPARRHRAAENESSTGQPPHPQPFSPAKTGGEGSRKDSIASTVTIAREHASAETSFSAPRYSGFNALRCTRVSRAI